MGLRLWMKEPEGNLSMSSGIRTNLILNRALRWCSAIVLLAALLVWPAEPAQATGTVGRNFRFTASPSDTLTVTLLESNISPEYVSIKSASGGVWGISQSEGQIINGHWTVTTTFDSFGGFNSTQVVEVSLGVYGQVELNGAVQDDIDQEIVNALDAEMTVQIIDNGTAALLTTTITADDTIDAGDAKWVTLRYRFGWKRTLTPAESSLMRTELANTERQVSVIQGVNTFSDVIELKCSGGRGFEVMNEITVSTQDWLGAPQSPFITCPGG